MYTSPVQLASSSRVPQCHTCILTRAANFSCVGTGKSFLLELIVNALREKYAEVKGAVAITASTGAAASAIGGEQRHSAVFVYLTPVKLQAKHFTHGHPLHLQIRTSRRCTRRSCRDRLSRTDISTRGSWFWTRVCSSVYTLSFAPLTPTPYELVSMIPPELLDLVARLVERARTAATRSTSTRPLGGMQVRGLHS